MCKARRRESIAAQFVNFVTYGYAHSAAAVRTASERPTHMSIDTIGGALFMLAPR